jgi:hypothetical protein
MASSSLARSTWPTPGLSWRCGDLGEVDYSNPRWPLETINLHSNSPDFSPPVACFTRDGCIVVGDARGGQVFAPGDFMSPIQNLVFPAEAGTPVDACPFGPNGFVFLTNYGHLLIFADS